MEFQAVPGPEAGALHGKIMRHESCLGPGGPCTWHGTGRASRSFSENWDFPMSGRPAGRPSGPPHYAEATEDLRMEFLPRRCFFRAIPPKAGLPGHKLGLEQKKDLKSEGGQARNQA